MKSILKIRYALTAVFCIFFLHGCLGGMAGWKGHIVRKENRIHIQEAAGRNSGVWKTGDLSLEYDYLIRRDNIQLDGKIVLTDKLTHFPTLDYLSVMVQFVDREGMVLDHEILYVSSSRTWIPMIGLSYSRSFVLPPETASISFSYSGKVSDGSGEDAIDWNFWNTP